MFAQYISYPSNADTESSFRLLIPSVGENFRDNSSSYFHEGDKSSIGNRSCLHVKASWDIIPLSQDYVVESNSSISYYKYLRYTCAQLPVLRWSSIMNSYPRVMLYSKGNASVMREYYSSTPFMAAGKAVFIAEQRIVYTNAPSSTQITELTYVIKLRKLPDKTVDITLIQRQLSAGTWTEYRESFTRSSTVIDVEYAPFWGTAKSIWSVHGNQFWWRVHNLAPLKDWGQLSAQCMKTGGKAYQTNSAQYLLELGQLSTLLEPLTGLIRGGLSVKKAANLWLSYYYGSRLTVKDTYAQISGIIRHSQRRIVEYDVLRARDFSQHTLQDGTTITGYRSLSIYYKVHSHWLVRTYDTLRRYGLQPSLSLAWDLVPLSFVVDWLVPIGTFLEHFDANTYRDSLNVIESILTTKYTQTSRADLLGFPGFRGNITLSVYDRGITPGTCPASTFSFDPIDFTGMKVLNGTALLVQRQK